MCILASYKVAVEGPLVSSVIEYRLFEKYVGSIRIQEYAYSVIIANFL